MAEIAKRFEAKHPGVRIDVQTDGSSRGVTDAASGLADIGMASRALKKEGAEQVVARLLALDGVAVIVHSPNKVPEDQGAGHRHLHRQELDEPCSALDPISAGVVEDLIVSFRGHYTVVVVTHDLAQDQRIADRVAVLGNHGHGGHIISQGSAAQVFSEPSDAVVAAYRAGRRA